MNIENRYDCQNCKNLKSFAKEMVKLDFMLQDINLQKTKSFKEMQHRLKDLEYETLEYIKAVF